MERVGILGRDWNIREVKAGRRALLQAGRETVLMHWKGREGGRLSWGDRLAGGH